MAPPLYSAPAVVTLVPGLTYRQLDYWVRRGIVRPSAAEGQGSGSRRLFTGQDLAEIRLVTMLRSLGVDLDRTVEFLDALRSAPGSVLVADSDGGIEAVPEAGVADAVTRSGGAAIVLTSAP